MKIKTLVIVAILLFIATGCYESGYHPTYIISEEQVQPLSDDAPCPK